MNKTIDTRRQSPTPTCAERSERIALALLLVVGALLMLVASRAAGDDSMPFAAGRTDRFTAPLGPRATVRIDNISGDIVAAPGKSFSVVVTTTVSAPTQRRADEVLGKTTIAQTNGDEGFGLETLWPDSRSWRDGRGRRHTTARIADCRISARYEVTLPAGVTAILKTVNGEVKVQDVDGELDVSSVNGNVRVAGTRRSFQARTVNGRVEAAAAHLPPGASVDCRAVNGGVSLTLPKDAKFDLTASAMSGAIASTFPLPARPEAEAPLPAKDRETLRPPRRIVVRDSDEGEDVVVDLREVEREIERSMRAVETEVRRAMRDAERAPQQARLFALSLGNHYSGSVGAGGASVHVSTLTGPILVLAAGTREADAKLLVSPKRSITIPRMRVVQISPPVSPVIATAPRPVFAPHTALAPRAPRGLPGDEDDVLRGDVSGDFLSTTTSSSYRIGNVSGRVRILTNGGEIHVASSGAGADLKTYGGAVRIGPVGGDLKALTMAGDVHAGAVGGSASAQTSGGDVRIESVRGALEARTGGGDVIVPSVGGAADVETGGGDVRLGLTARRASVTVKNAGGDVTLTLPADFRGDFELQVSGAWPDQSAIRSDFPEISVTKRAGSQQASGSVNGGGAKVVVKTSSGTIRIRKR